MSKALKALERIKNAGTIYVGCASDIYTRYSFECNEIEKSLKALEIIKRCPKEVIEEVETYYSFEELYEDWGKMAFVKSKEEFELVREVLGL